MNSMGSPPEDTMRLVSPTHNRVAIAPHLHDVAEIKSGLHISDRLIVTANDLPTGDQMRRLAGLAGRSGVDADHHDPDIAPGMIDLHGQIGDVGRPVDAAHGADRPVDIVRDARGFGIGTERVLLHYPEVRTAVVQHRLGVINHAAIDAGHGQGDADEQSQPDAGEDEFPPVMKDVAPGKADHLGPPASCSTMRIRVRAVRPRWL
jgi:hypothetical protein